MNTDLGSSRTLVGLVRMVVVVGAVIVGGRTLGMAILSLGPEHVHRKDFLQEYLLGKAVREGYPPYAPLPELVERYLGTLPHTVFPHPTPHPPPMALLSLPLTALDYQVAAGVWIVIQLICIIISLWLLLSRTSSRPSMPMLALLTLAFLGTDAYFHELVFGQLQSLVLLLLVLAWLALRSQRDLVGGAALGVALALKFMGWPIIIYLAAQRRWRPVSWAATSWVLLNAVAALAMGLETVVDFYQRVPAEVSLLYRGDPANLALSSIGWRIFSGMESMVFLTIEAPPLIRWDLGAAVLSVLLPVLFAVSTVAAARRARSFDAAFALLAVASALVNPIAWSHYGLLATMALIWLWRRLPLLGLPRAKTHMGILVTAGLFVPTSVWYAMAMLFSRDGMVVPFSAALITLMPTAILVALCFLVSVSGENSG